MTVRIGFPAVNPDTQIDRAVWLETDESGVGGKIRFNDLPLNNTRPALDPALSSFLLRLARRGTVSLYSSPAEQSLVNQQRQLSVQGESGGLALEVADHFRVRNARDGDTNVLLSGLVDVNTGTIVKPLGDSEALRMKARLAAGSPATSLILVAGDCTDSVKAILQYQGELPARDASERLQGSPGLYSLTVDANGRCKYGTTQPWWDYVGDALGLLRRETRRAKTPSWYSFESALVRTRRQEALESLLARSASGDASRLITVHGSGGTGKTRISTAAAVTVGDHYPGGEFFLSLRRQAETRNDLIGAIRAAITSERPGSHEFENNIYASLLAALPDAPTLLILDNFELAEKKEAARLVRDLLEIRPRLTVLVASQRQLGLVGLEEVFSVDQGMEEAEAAELFELRARRTGAPWLQAPGDGDAINRIVKAVEYIPLGIVLAAAWFDTCPLSEIAEGLERASGEFTELPPEDIAPIERHSSMTACVEWSCRLLAEAERRAFVSLGLFGETVAAGAVAAVLGCDIRSAALLLNALERRALVQEDHRDTEGILYKAHGYIRAHAECLLRNCLERPEMEKAFVQHYHRLASSANAPKLHFKRELSNFVAAARLAGKHESTKEVLDITARVERPLQHAHRGYEWRDLELLALNALRSHDWPERMSHTLAEVGEAHRSLNEYTAAEEYHRRAVVIAAKHLHGTREAAAREAHARILSLLARHNEALEELTRAYAIRDLLPGDVGIAQTHLLMAKAYGKVTDWPKAAWHATESIKRTQPGTPNQFTARALLADIYQNDHQLDAAEGEYRSLIADNPTNLRIRAQLAGVVSEQGRHQEAHEILDELLASPSLKRSPPNGTLRLALQKKARVFDDEKKIDEAIATYDRALKLAAKSSDRYSLAILLDKKGRVLGFGGRVPAATACLYQAREIFARIGLDDEVRKIDETLLKLNAKLPILRKPSLQPPAAQTAGVAVGRTRRQRKWKSRP